MKVLMIGQLPKEFGGTYTNGVCNVVYELSKCKLPGVRLCVYATNVSDENAMNLNGVSTYRGSKKRPLCILVKILTHPLTTIKQWKKYKECHANPIRYEYYRDNIERIIDEERPDIVHCMNLIQGSAARYAIGHKNIPYVQTFHGVNRAFDYEARAIQPLITHTTGLTKETISDLVELNYSHEKLSQIPNGIDTASFYFDEAARQKIRETLSLSKDTTLMMTVGSLCKRKGQLDFCRLLLNMPKDFIYKYVIIGEGGDYDDLVSFIRINKLQDKIQVVGYVENNSLYKYYSAADVYIHGSYSEGQALSEMEAYTCDLKIAINKMIINTIVTDTDDENYYIFDYKNFNYDSFVEWAKNHKENRKSRKQYGWNQIFSMYYDVYKRLLP